MKPGRNDPCWCGSGKKYKHCHLAEDRAAPAGLREIGGQGGSQPGRAGEPRSRAEAFYLGSTDEAREEQATPPSLLGGKPMDAWEADLSALTIAFDDTPDARPGIVLIVDSASGFVVHQELLAHAPNSPVDIARTLVAKVHAGAQSVGGWPRALWVRHQPVADAMAGELRARGIPVLSAAILPSLDEAVSSLRSFMDLPATVAAPSMVETWAGWGQPRERVAALFTAAAGFYRAAAWRWIANNQVLEIQTARGGAWAVTVMGNGGQEFGLALYEDAGDLMDLCEGPAGDPAEHFENLTGGVISLLFEARRDLPRRMQQEIADARWEVAGQSAYPSMITLNMPGGGIDTDAFLDLIDILNTGPRFAVAHKDALTSAQAELPVEWTDDANGALVSYSGYWGFEEDDQLWPPLYALSPSLAAGTGARPEAALGTWDVEESLAEEARTCVESFQNWLADTSASASPRKTGLKHFLPSRETPSIAEPFVETAELFLVDFVVGYHHIPIEAVTEFDLRVFLYDWYPRKIRQEWSDAEAAMPALARLFAFLAAERGIQAPWAEAILREEAEAFRVRFETFPGGFFWDEGVQDWQAELYIDLSDRILLHDPNLGDRDEWGATMGLDEARLDHELQRRWLIWRDALIRAGTTDPGGVVVELRKRQRAWEKARHPAFGGRTPVQVIQAERKAMAQRMREQKREAKGRGPKP